MRSNILIFTVLAIILSSHAILVLDTARAEEDTSCPESVPGFFIGQSPDTSAVESEETATNTTPIAESGQGTITGGINYNDLNITLDRNASTLTGVANGDIVDLQIDREEGKITGEANQSPVNLTVRSGAQCTIILGDANMSPVRLHIDWAAGTLSGYCNGKPVRVAFRRQGEPQGVLVTLEGHANYAPLELTYDSRSGKLTGGMENSKVDLTFTNANLNDFIVYFFIFLTA